MEMKRGNNYKTCNMTLNSNILRTRIFFFYSAHKKHEIKPEEPDRCRMFTFTIKKLTQNWPILGTTENVEYFSGPRTVRSFQFSTVYA